MPYRGSGGITTVIEACVSRHASQAWSAYHEGAQG